jgi:ubiquinone/menaquinone biosynthesis C-methylase UbiE
MPNEPERTPSLGGWRPPPRIDAGEPDYGFDEPWVVAKALGVAALAALASVGVDMLRVGGEKLPLAGSGLRLVALGSAAIGASLSAYAKRGKLNHRDRVLALVAWEGHERVLDIGTGRGLLMIGAAKRLTSGKAFGIDLWRDSDLSGNNRENTMRNAFLEGVVDKVDVRFADARKLEFQRNSFDVVLSTQTLHTIEKKDDRAAACREIARVLKPGGIAIVSDSSHVTEYAAALRAAGLEVTSQPFAFDAYTYLRTIVATKSPLIDLTAGFPA